MRSLVSSHSGVLDSSPHFELFIDGHFCKRARDILLACSSYIDGLQVGCLASGKNKMCSIKFKKDVTACVKPLVTEFNKRGAKVAFQMKENSEDISNLLKCELALREFDLFKILRLLAKKKEKGVVDENVKFDTVVDHSDHFFSVESSAMNQPPKDLVDKIRDEWRILAENLPETIFVRVYKDRMDLLRAVIIGQQWTPYHNGLFFFDVGFPSNYPDSPPLVHYRSGDLGINPNLYKCGKDRILNTNPLYNDITYSLMKGSIYGEQSSAILLLLGCLINEIELPFLEENFQEDPPPEVPMADNRTMAELLQAPTEGYEDAIVILEIAANNFDLKHGLINLVQNKQFFGHDKEDPHAHIRYFNKITSTTRVPNVPSSSIKLMLFPFSLEGAARIWLEKEPPRSIQTWDDLVSKFINQFFPPSKTKNLRNEITRF
nr:ubiquitin-conjugating enzyme/RWD-like protein [Tanacetum cinerariifolium]